LTRLAGTDPARALAQAATVRDAAVRAGLLDVRLAVDEVECRLLRDLDVSRAERTAEAGLSRSGRPLAMPHPSCRGCA
jgi:hypothetical protein